MNAKEPTTGRYLFEDDFQDSSFDTTRQTPEEIRKNAHITSGGEQALVPCVKCGGSGMTRWGSCFRCKGKGRIGVRSAAASKAKVTREQNEAKRREEFAETYSAECAYIHKRADKGSTFYASFVLKLGEYGTLTENQLAVVHKDMAKDAEFYAAKKAEREAAAPTVEISAIEKLFDTAVENDVKRPIFRADGLEISRAPMTGRNAGALYVKANGEYAGKIVEGKFHKVYAAPAETVDRLMAVAADPLKEAMAYGRKFGNCALCGRGLVDPVSIRAMVGPICSAKWNLDYLRDAARESLAGEE